MVADGGEMAKLVLRRGRETLACRSRVMMKKGLWWTGLSVSGDGLWRGRTSSRTSITTVSDLICVADVL
jgi:hypothetical protein